MTKENLIALKSLISHFNLNNVRNDVVYKIVDIEKYREGAYSLTLEFDLMFSLDVNDLMKWCFDSGVSVRIMQLRGNCCMDFQ